MQACSWCSQGARAMVANRAVSGKTSVVVSCGMQLASGRPREGRERTASE